MTRLRRWLVINPNTSPAITEGLLAAVAQHAPPGTEVAGATAAFGFR